MLTFSLPIGKYCAQFHSLIGNGNGFSNYEQIYDHIAKKSPFYALDHYSAQLYSSKFHLVISYISPDFQSPEQTEISLLMTTNLDVKHSPYNFKNSSKITLNHAIFHELINDLETLYHITKNESQKMIELYYLTFRLILACYQHEKIGRDFIQSGYIFDLLGKYLPTLNNSQKTRFYYWELLKFDINHFLTNWYTFDSFEHLISQFID